MNGQLLMSIEPISPHHGDVIKVTNLHICKQRGKRNRGNWYLSSKRKPVWAIYIYNDGNGDWTILCGGTSAMQDALDLYGPHGWPFTEPDQPSDPIHEDDWPDEVIVAVAKLKLLGEV